MVSDVTPVSNDATDLRLNSPVEEDSLFNSDKSDANKEDLDSQEDTG